MTLLTNKSTLGLWQEVIAHAEERCAIQLHQELEMYLVSLLMRHTNHPELAKQIFAKAFLKAVQLHSQERMHALQCVGDECLIYAGLFPKTAAKRLVTISYFVNLGKSAYSAISYKTNDLFDSLSIQFVSLMDVLQSISHSNDLLPLEAYEQWDQVGSLRALNLLKNYTHGLPLKK